MICRPLDELLATLRRRVNSPAERVDAERERRAIALAARLPLVHRTAPATNPGTWRSILQSGVIRAGKPHTPREQRLGSTRSAYFFLGHPAWPTGLAAFVLHPHADILATATFTPFDTGGLDKHVEPIDPQAPPLDEATLDALVLSHTGAGNDVAAFAGPFISAHVRRPEAYVSYPRFQQPDWPSFHGVRSRSGDRRCWTIELQAHEDVRVTPPEERIDTIVVGDKAVGLRLDDEVFGLCTQVETEDDVQTAVIRHILERATEPSP